MLTLPSNQSESSYLALSQVKNSENQPSRQSTVATPPGSYRPANRHHATQQKAKHHFRHAPHRRWLDSFGEFRRKFGELGARSNVVLDILQWIIGFRAKGGSISETAEFVNCSRATVVKVYRAWQNGTVQNQRRGKCGAPRAIDDRGERRLRRCVRADRRATVEQLTTKMNQATKSVSQTTIQRTLLRLGLRSRRLVRAPMLTAVHRRRRLEFARQYSSWTSTEWRHVAFSDESRFMLHRTDGRWRIRRETSERNHPATIAGTVQARGGSIMVWGMFSWHSLGSLIIVEGTIDQYKYASVLADHVHPYMRIVFPQDDGIFQQDNARCHTAASVRAWFEEHQDEFTVLPLPGNSPDLNPIEHLWYHLDRVVRAMDPKPRYLAQLATALESAWLNIPENTFRDLSDSLPARLAAVHSAKGGYSGF
ncbi:transposable element Tcb1 transposase [Trichonephila clavipes]|nr:transposable element Tcb1 transposase [Trichonephila clavipes]